MKKKYPQWVALLTVVAIGGGRDPRATVRSPWGRTLWSTPATVPTKMVGSWGTH